MNAKQVHTLGPYYVASDDAHDCPDHRNSGLALVDTGRAGDWPVARLCEWPTAQFIVRACNAHDDLLAALRAIADNARMDVFEMADIASAAIAKAERKS